MEGGVPPLAEVQPGQHAGLAGHPGVDLVVWQHHRVHLTMIMLGNGSTTGGVPERSRSRPSCRRGRGTASPA